MRKFFITALMLLLVGFAFMAQNSKAQTCRDGDGDGVCDVSDACPARPGPLSNDGCPLPDDEPTHDPNDRDGDGNPDNADRCPNDGGPASNGGCPEDQPSQTEESPSDPCASITAAPNCNPGTQQPELPDTGRCVLGTKYTDRVNVRIRPSTQTDIVGQLEPDAIVPVLDWVDMADGRWYRIDIGWVYGNVIRLGGRCAERPADDGEPELVDCPSLQLLSPVDDTVSGNTLFDWTSPISEVPVAFYQISIYDASDTLLLDEWTFEPTTEVLIDLDSLGLAAGDGFKWEVTALDESEYWLCRSQRVNDTMGNPSDEPELADCPSLQLLSPVDSTVSGDTLFSWTSPISEVPVAFYQITLYDGNDNWLFDAWTFEPTTQVWIDIDELGLPAGSSIKWEVTALDESEYWLCRSQQVNDTTGESVEEPEMVDCPSMQLLSPVDTTVSGMTLFSWTSPISEVPVAFYQISLYDASDNLLLDEWTFEPTTEVWIDLNTLGLAAGAAFKWEVTALDNSEYWLCRSQQVNDTLGNPNDEPEMVDCPSLQLLSPVDTTVSGMTLFDWTSPISEVPVAFYQISLYDASDNLLLDEWTFEPTTEVLIDLNTLGLPAGAAFKWEVTALDISEYWLCRSERMNATTGSPNDWDGDGVQNTEDRCPRVPGTAELNGCPPPADGDGDGDKVPDDVDHCTNFAGLLVYDGCPPPTDGDTDGDGTPDGQDECYDVTGAPSTAGCPDPSDGDDDGDQVDNEDDHCSPVAGIAAYDGCRNPGEGDDDGDGVPNDEDECRDAAGVPSTHGCPNPQEGDDDGDGVDNEDDPCPQLAGLFVRKAGKEQQEYLIVAHDGCQNPSEGDNDGDGVPNTEDRCPTVAGSLDLNGCPNPQTGDSDGDGVMDADDHCSHLAGLPEYYGCPPTTEGDTDGDSSPDDTDQCYDVTGAPVTEGCPNPQDGDSDGDGVDDEDDHCSTVAGIAEFNGCPNPSEGDDDGDSVPNEQDECPGLAGVADTHGCPNPQTGDSDGDGVDDEDDACPEVAGLFVRKAGGTPQTYFVPGSESDGCLPTDAAGSDS